jgi:NAD-dependent deacetylase
LLLVTQNTDGLHLTAGNSPERVVEIHGHVRSVRCLSCGAVTTTGAVIERTLFSDPRCRQVIRGSVCDGILKTAVVSFGESLDPVQYHRAERALLNADLLVCVGSTLSVYPIADILGVAVRALPGRLIILNDQPTSFDSRAAVVLSGDITTTLPALLDDQAN